MNRSERELLHKSLHTIHSALASGFRGPLATLPPEREAVDCRDLALLVVVPRPISRKEGPALSGEERELLSKMIQAIGLSLENDALLVEGFDIPPFSGCPGPRGLLLVRDEPGRACFAGPGGLPLATIHHPALLLKEPALKRQSWENLKALQAAMAASPGAAASEAPRA